MDDLTLVTFDWVPELPRGYVRDIRVRWALEEAGLAYRVESAPFRVRNAEHFSHQPFGQAPWLIDKDISIFESGAILLHLGERSDALMPADPNGRAEVIAWVFAALNSVEAASLPWSIFKFSGDTTETPGRKHLDEFLGGRLDHMEKVLAEREWLAGAFSIADILMADVLRLVDRFDGLAGHPACRGYVARATARPSFVKAHADQIAHFASADRAMPKPEFKPGHYLRMSVVIYHNPACGTSRKVLARLKEAGREPEVVEYLKYPPDRETLKKLLARMGKSARDILRKRGTPYDELGLDDPATTDEQIFAAIEKHPILIERPIVIVDDKVALCRPAETVEELL